MAFPQNFIWGAAAASYQVEGAAYVDGKGLSVWDTFSHESGKIWENNNGDISCDHYHRFQEDARLMSEIGLKAYRLSISWPRVMPSGVGKVNEKGLGFYDRLVDELLANGIQPWITLFHWDYPHELFLRGGWLNRESVEWFSEYTRVIVDRLSDRVSHWMTLNEPQCFIGLGHQTGEHAPGLKLGIREILIAAHHSLMAHGRSVQVIREYAKTKPVIGAAPVGKVGVPFDETRKNIDVANKFTFSVAAKGVFNNTWFGDPMIFGRYPEDGIKLFGSDMFVINQDDLKIINQPLDFYGTNIYSGTVVRANELNEPEMVPMPDGPPLTTMVWRVLPESLYWGSKFLYERYKLPIVITENGMANPDWISLDGKVHDPQRIDFVKRYLLQLHRAIDEKIPIDGYFQWSIMDNFEWAHGYKQRFGLIFVDYPSGKRILKDSAYWYSDVIKSNGAVLFR